MPSSRIPQHKIDAIRKATEESDSTSSYIADEYNVSWKTVDNIKKGLPPYYPPKEKKNINGASEIIDSEGGYLLRSKTF